MSSSRPSLIRPRSWSLSLTHPCFPTHGMDHIFRSSEVLSIIGGSTLPTDLPCFGLQAQNSHFLKKFSCDVISRISQIRKEEWVEEVKCESWTVLQWEPKGLRGLRPCSSGPAWMPSCREALPVIFPDASSRWATFYTEGSGHC